MVGSRLDKPAATGGGWRGRATTLWRDVEPSGGFGRHIGAKVNLKKWGDGP